MKKTNKKRNKQILTIIIILSAFFLGFFTGRLSSPYGINIYRSTDNHNSKEVPSVTQTPSPTEITAEPSTTIQTPERKCQFNKEQMTTLMRQYNYSEEQINTFFTINPGDCFNLNIEKIRANQTNDRIDELELKQRDLENRIWDLEW